ncbi:MAG TPA: Mpo1-like protein [Polyangiaceae bacterium]|nr:Mpo1-like protein [Polyangiaceae bacterium]
MMTLVRHLSNYAAYHRDPRNVATHFVGIPLIVVGTAALLARPSVTLFGLTLSPLVFVAAAAAGFYLALDRRYGAVLTALLGLAGWAGISLAAGPTGSWLLGSAGLFVGGWALQFVGHALEGRKPAFVDDLIGLLIGPLFLVAEASFALGLRRELRDEIEARLEVTRTRPLPAR